MRSNARPATPAAAMGLAARLRAAGCVFAEDEAQALTSSGLAGAALDEAVRRREAGEPLEHIVGWVEFDGLRLHVGPGAFIPRQRSVLLAREAVRAMQQRRGGASFVEAYAGVGPIAASVARSTPTAEVYVVDVDPVPLEYAARNVPAGTLLTGDGLNALPGSVRGEVSVIAAVPPYVPQAEIALMPAEARDHEPPMSRDGGADGLDHVRALIEQSNDWLAPEGVLLIELHRSQADDAADAAQRADFSTKSTHGDDGHTVMLRVTRRVRGC